MGNYITAQTSIGRIDDRSKVLIDIWVPERFAPQIRVGQPLTAESTAFPGETYSGEINAVDNMLDEASRTLHVRAEVPNTLDRLRAGMSFSVTVLFPGIAILRSIRLPFSGVRTVPMSGALKTASPRKLTLVSYSAIQPTF